MDDELRDRLSKVEAELLRDLEYARLRTEPERGYVPIICAECGRVTDDGRGWKAHLTVEPVEAVVDCPSCAEREFE